MNVQIDILLLFFGFVALMRQFTEQGECFDFVRDSQISEFPSLRFTLR